MSFLLDLIFPKTCFGCGQVGSYFCPKCLSKIKYNSVKHFSDPQKEGSLSLFRYQSLIRASIQELKYKFVIDFSDQLASIFSQKIISDFPHLLNYWQQNNFVLIPIPLFKTRQNWRGFNQSILLGQKIAQNLNLNFSDQILYRHRYTFTQAKIKTHQGRQKNIKNAFVPIFPILQNIILFDDVASSFSTLNSAFNSLKSVGLNRCWYLTLAG
jgi:ComF family protein